MSRLVVVTAGAAIVLALSACGPKQPTAASPMPGMSAEEHAKMMAPKAAATTTAVTNKTCPVQKGNPVNPAIKTVYKGHTIYFCCDDCPKEFAKNPEKYMAELNNPTPAPATGGHDMSHMQHQPAGQGM